MNISKEDFFGVLFNAINYYKLAYLSRAGQGGYSQHMHFKETYTQLSDFTDQFIQYNQGEFQEVYNIEVPKTNTEQTPLEFSETFLQCTRAARKLFNLSWQQSELDTLEKLIINTIYKTKFLK